MPGNFEWGFGCGCCECPQSLCVNVRCTGTSIPICGATVELWDEAGTTLLDTCTTCDVATDYVADFEAGNSEYFSAADASDLRATENFWFAGWVKVESLTGGGCIVSKHESPTTNLSYHLKYNSSGDVTFYASLDGTPLSFVTRTLSGALTAGTWVFLFATVDGLVMRLGKNGGTFSSAPIAESINAGTGEFRFGRSEGVTTEYLDGLARRWAFGYSPSVAESTIATDLYNSGNGLSYGAVTSTQKTNWGLAHWWEMDEVSGDRADSHGTTTLTDNNTVGSLALTASTDTSGGCCFEVDFSPPITYTVRVSKTGYVTVDDDAEWEGQVTFTSCSQSKSVLAELCPSEFIFSVQALSRTGFGSSSIPNCGRGVPGLTVNLTGDVTGTGVTTDPDGRAIFTVAKAAGKCSLDIDVEIVGDLGFATKTGSVTVFNCIQYTYSLLLDCHPDYVQPSGYPCKFPIRRTLSISNSKVGATLYNGTVNPYQTTQYWGGYACASDTGVVYDVVCDPYSSYRGPRLTTINALHSFLVSPLTTGTCGEVRWSVGWGTKFVGLQALGCAEPDPLDPYVEYLVDVSPCANTPSFGSISSGLVVIECPSSPAFVAEGTYSYAGNPSDLMATVPNNLDDFTLTGGD
jgi:hypothetical protein